MQDESAPQGKSAPSAEKENSSALTDLPEGKDAGISGGGASAPKHVTDNASGAPEPSKASAALSTAGPSSQSADDKRERRLRLAQLHQLDHLSRQRAREVPPPMLT